MSGTKPVVDRVGERRSTGLACLALAGGIAALIVGVGRPRPKLDAAPMRLDINTAPLPLVSCLPMVGKAMLVQIEEERRAAPFRSLAELRRVRGIGPKTLEGFRPYLRFDDGPARDEAIRTTGLPSAR